MFTNRLQAKVRCELNPISSFVKCSITGSWNAVITAQTQTALTPCTVYSSGSSITKSVTEQKDHRNRTAKEMEPSHLADIKQGGWKKKNLQTTIQKSLLNH